MAISPDGRWGITAGEDKAIRLWNLTARFPAAEQIVLHGHEGWVGSLAVSPDGQWLASGSYDGTARLWDLHAASAAGSEGRCPAAEAIVLRGHQGWVGTIAFSPAGGKLATGSYDKSVRVWDLRGLGDFRRRDFGIRDFGISSPKSPNPEIPKSPQPKSLHPEIPSRTLSGHTGRVCIAAFSPDGRWLISGSFDRTARVWDMSEQDPTTTSIVLRGHAGPINTLAVSPDSRWLATGSGEAYGEKDYTVRIWDLRLDTLLGTARRAAAEHLSPQQQQAILLEAAQSGEVGMMK